MAKTSNFSGHQIFVTKFYCCPETLTTATRAFDAGGLSVPK